MFSRFEGIDENLRHYSLFARIYLRHFFPPERVVLQSIFVQKRVSHLISFPRCYCTEIFLSLFNHTADFREYHFFLNTNMINHLTSLHQSQNFRTGLKISVFRKKYVFKSSFFSNSTTLFDVIPLIFAISMDLASVQGFQSSRIGVLV